MAAANLSQTLLNIQKASLYPVFEAVVEYLEGREVDTPLTADELFTEVLGMKASSDISLVVQKRTSGENKKAEIDEKNGCQRIMCATSKRSGRACGEKVYVNTATGDVARYCTRCIGMKTCRSMTKDQLAA